jgi:hypothetical protein
MRVPAGRRRTIGSEPSLIPSSASNNAPNRRPAVSTSPRARRRSHQPAAAPAELPFFKLHGRPQRADHRRYRAGRHHAVVPAGAAAGLGLGGGSPLRPPRASPVTALGYEHLRRHDLHHTGPTWMADAGVPVHDEHRARRRPRARPRSKLHRSSLPGSSDRRTQRTLSRPRRRRHRQSILAPGP